MVIESEGGRLVAAFERRGTIAEVSPTRLAAVDTVYAMTVHKSQGSQYEAVAFLLPSPDSRILTRELLYTAVTRARERLILVGPEDFDPGRHRAADHPGLGAPAGPLGRGGLTARARLERRSPHHPPAPDSRCLGCPPREKPWSHANYSRFTAWIQGSVP